MCFRSGAAASGTKFPAPLMRHCSLSAGRITRSLMESCPMSRPFTFFCKGFFSLHFFSGTQYNDKSEILNQKSGIFLFWKYPTFVMRFLFMLIQHFLNTSFGHCTKGAFLFFRKFFRIDWLAIFDGYMTGSNFGHMVQDDICGMADRYRNDRTAGFFCNLEAAFFEFQQRTFFSAVSRSFREDSDRYALFDVFDSL